MSHVVAIEGEVGSIAHGLGVPESDHDLMRVVLEPLDSLLGVSAQVETERLRPRGDKEASMPGDTEITVYPLRKYASLALAANPNVMPLLYTPTLTAPDTIELQSISEAFLSKKVAHTHGALALNAVKRLKGELPPRVSRPEEVSKNGYDTKAAMHAIRALYQGIELCTLRKIVMPVPAPMRDTLLDIRRGKIPLEHVLNMADVLGTYLEQCANQLPEHPDLGRVNGFLKDVYLSTS